MVDGSVGYCIHCGWPVAYEGVRIAPEDDRPRSGGKPQRCADTACVTMPAHVLFTRATEGRCVYVTFYDDSDACIAAGYVSEHLCLTHARVIARHLKPCALAISPLGEADAVWLWQLAPRRERSD